MAGVVRSFTATNSMSGLPRALRKTLRPMRPKPLDPTFTAAMISVAPVVLLRGVDEFLTLGSAAGTLTPTKTDATTLTEVVQMPSWLRAHEVGAEGASHLRVASTLCYKRGMRELREWISEKMRRRPRRGPNESESTGKSGQELPANQQAPLRPTYPEATPARPAEATPSPAVKHHAEPAGIADAASSAEPVAAKPEPQMVMETQPESLGTPPAEQAALKSPKGYVVLTIGLPGSGKTTWYKRRGVTPLSSDLLRTLLFDDITEQRYQGLVFSTLRSLAARPTDRQDAVELCGCDEPVAA